MQSTELPGIEANATEVVAAAIRNCLDCRVTCLQTLHYCLRTDDQHLDRSHLNTLLDCATACDLSAEYLARASVFQGKLGILTAEICTNCARSCEHVSSDNPQLRACAEACRRCASSLQQNAFASSALGPSV